MGLSKIQSSKVLKSYHWKRFCEFMIEDIISTKNLDEALSKAKKWCRENLPKYFRDFQQEKYDIFRYVIDNEMIGYDMRLDTEESGLIRVSTRKIKYYLKREQNYRLNKILGREPIEIDPESMFVHEISEFIILNKMVLLNQPSYRTNVHQVAREIENINRIERNLKKWPEN